MKFLSNKSTYCTTSDVTHQLTPELRPRRFRCSLDDVSGGLTSSVEDVAAGALVLDGEVGVVGGDHLVVFVPVICRETRVQCHMSAEIIFLINESRVLNAGLIISCLRFHTFFVNATKGVVAYLFL